MDMAFTMLINVKISSIVDILTFISMTDFVAVVTFFCLEKLYNKKIKKIVDY